jgi:DNA-binding NarL/FixJ family response regulator
MEAAPDSVSVAGMATPLRIRVEYRMDHRLVRWCGGGIVEHSDTKVLAAGIERMTFEKLAPVIRRDAVQIEWVATPEAGVSLASKNRYDVILMDAEPCDWPLEQVVRSFRASSSPSRGAAILVLAEPDQVDVARALRSRGVNRVMLVTDPPEIICDQMATLLEVAPRVRVRLATNVEAALGNKGRELFCQTVNLSSTGMLIRTQNRPPLGTPVVFKITFPEQFGTICGRGELIRHATIGQGGVDGVGIRFSSFANDGADVLQRYMEAMTTEREPDPLTDVVGQPADGQQPAPRNTPNSQRVRRKKTSNPVILEFE